MSNLITKHLDLILKLALVSGLVLIGIGVFTTIHMNFTTLAADESHFQITSDKDFRSWGKTIEIDTVLYTPIPQYDVYDSKPAVVFVHGFISDNLYFRGYANELCKRGFVTMCITARGHAGSSGQYGLTWENETLSTVKWLRDNADLYDIDINNIGIMGHSMGAFSVTIAAIIDGQLGNNWIDSTIAIGGPYYNITGDPGFFSMAGGLIPENIDPLIDKFQEYFYPTATEDFGDQLDNCIIEGRLDAGEKIVPRNYLNMNGEFDEAFSLESTKQIVWNFGKAATFGTNDYKSIVYGKLYGNPADGSARKAVKLMGEHHASEGQNFVAVKEMVEWFESSMQLAANPNYPGLLEESTITSHLRITPVMLTAIGVILVLMISSFLLSKWLSNKDFKAEASSRVEKKDKYIHFGIYTGIYAGLTALVMPLIVIFNLEQVIVGDFMITSFAATFMVVQSLLLLPAVVILMIWENKKFGESWEDFGIDYKYIGKAFLYGLLLFLILFLSLVFVVTISIKNLIPYRIVGFLEMFAFAFLYFMVNGIITHGLVQNKMRDDKSESRSKLPISEIKELLLSSLINGVVQGVGVGIFMIMFAAEFGFTGIISIIAIPLCILLFFISSFAMSIFYFRIRNVVGVATLGALLIAFVCSIVAPSIFNAGSIVIIIP